MRAPRRASSLSLRRGMASMEAVIATGIAMPVMAFLLMMGIRACKNLFHVIGVLVGWPIL